MARATASLAGGRSYVCMGLPGSSTRDSLRRLETMIGRRRDIVTAGVAVAMLVAIALAMMARGAPAQIAPPATEPDAVVQPTSSAATVVVHVAGAVRSPGVYALPLGSRVTDAIAAAGGAVGRADLDALNLAAPLSDGEKIEVVRRGTASQGVSTAPASAGPGSGALVSINNADEAALDTIPGIGPVTAEAILKYRSEIGSFDSIDQLIDVPGIGPATLESIRPYVTL
ncbi:MAG: helix-hairpin-helix domain-containing protein [Actinomycetota bacterium]|nr:helix-hairpin-helix domain-containing protein [Actinomycetota bacterium]